MLPLGGRRRSLLCIELGEIECHQRTGSGAAVGAGSRPVALGCVTPITSPVTRATMVRSVISVARRSRSGGR
jgi:hypothetical protein